MTRRKKTKTAARENAPCGLAVPVTTPSSATKATATVVSLRNNQSYQHSSPLRQAVYLCTSSSAATSSIPRSSISSSIVSEVAPSSNLNKVPKNPQQKKKAVNTKVTYVTEQIHIYPKHPVLTVDRLPNLDYHIKTLTESIGRRPRVYEHGKGVRFISETNDEYRTIQRYLAKIESAERIAWCSYTVPSGNILKVNVKVRKVEVLKVTQDIQIAQTELNLENGTNPIVATQKQSLHKDTKSPTINSPIQNGKRITNDGKTQDVQLPTRDYSYRKSNLTLKDVLPEGVKLSTKDLSPITSHQGLEKNPDTNIKLGDKKKKPRDVAQNRSYKRTNRY